MNRSFERFYPLIVFLFACLLYVNTIPNDYNLDDELVTRDHRTTSKGISAIPEIIDSYYYEDDIGYKYGYRPVTHIFFAIEHEFLGENPHLSHVINVLLYAFLCLAIYYLTQKLAPDKGPMLALLVALVFTVHPLHTEVIASIKNRDEILSLLFGVTSFLIALLAKSKSTLKTHIFYWILSLIFFSLGLLSKQSIVILAFLIPLASIWFGNRKWVLLPMLFFLIGSSLFFYINKVDVLVSGVIMLSVASFIWLLNSISEFNPLSILKQIREDESRQTQMNFFLIFTVLIVFALALYLDHTWLNVLAVAYAFLVIFIVKSEMEVFAVSLLIFTYSALFGFFVEDERSILLGFFALVFLNEKLLDKKKYLLILAAVIAIVVTSVQTDITLQFDVFVLIYLIAILAHLFYKPLWFLLPLLLFLTEDTLYGVFYGILILVTLWRFIPLSWNVERGLNFIKKYTVIWLLIFSVIQVYQMSSFAILSAKILEEARIEEIRKSGIEKEVLEPSNFVDLDRPILYVENPIVENWNLSSRLAIGVNSTVFYLKKLVLPFPLTFYYGYGGFPINPLISWQTMLAFVLLCLIVLGLGFSLWKKSYYVAFALLFLVLNLLPYSNFIMPIAGIVGERLAFTASLGFAFLVGSSFYRFGIMQKSKLVSGVFLIVLFASSSAVLLRNFMWKDKLTLYVHDIQHVPESAQANALLAYEYMNVSLLENAVLNRGNAIIHFEKAINLYPDYFNWQLDLGKVYFENRSRLKAGDCFAKALALDSTYSETYLYLLDIARAQHNWSETIKLGTYIVERNFDDVIVLFGLSEAYYYTKQYEKVIEVNDRIISKDNSLPEAYLNKSYAYLKLDDLDRARLELDMAQQLNPLHPDVLKIQKELQILR